MTNTMTLYYNTYYKEKINKLIYCQPWISFHLGWSFESKMVYGNCWPKMQILLQKLSDMERLCFPGQLLCVCRPVSVLDHSGRN